jgi:hypothetical protein
LFSRSRQTALNKNSVVANVPLQPENRALCCVPITEKGIVREIFATFFHGGCKVLRVKVNIKSFASLVVKGVSAGAF